jgi:hypothetical protein
MYPQGVIQAQPGNNDVGVVHTVWAKADYGTGAGDYKLYLGELTTQDNGTNYTCQADMHFPVPVGELFSPQRIVAYYQASDGWGTPSMSYLTSDVIGSNPGTLNTGTPDTGSDYSIVGATFASAVSGTSDVKVRFSVSSAASGTVNIQRFFGAIIQGKAAGIRRGGI